MGNKQRATEWPFSSSRAAVSEDHSVCSVVLASLAHKHEDKEMFLSPAPFTIHSRHIVVLGFIAQALTWLERNTLYNFQTLLMLFRCWLFGC